MKEVKETNAVQYLGFLCGRTIHKLLPQQIDLCDSGQ